MLPQYHDRASAWLAAAYNTMAGDLDEDTVNAAHRALGRRFDPGTEMTELDRRIAVAGVLAAHYIAEQLYTEDVDYAEDVRTAAQALAGPQAAPLNERLQLARQLAAVAPTDEQPLREMTACLRKNSPEQMVAFAHLARAVIPRDREILRAAWVDLFAGIALRYLVSAAPQVKALAVAAVKPRGRHQKDRIAEAARISRPTLDGWIKQADNHS